MNSHPNVIIIGIAGCSRCGKTLLTRELMNQYKNMIGKNSDFADIFTSMHLDRYFNRFKIKSNIIITNKGNIYGNWEFPGALDWDDFYSDILKEINKITIKIKSSPFPNKKGIIFVEGFLLFSPLLSKSYENSNYLNIFDYYIYICLDKYLAKERRMKTTTVPEDYYDCILWPEHIKYCSGYANFFKEKFNNNKNILIIDGNKQYPPKTISLCILKWINIVKELDNNICDVYDSLFVPFEKQINILQKNFA